MRRSLAVMTMLLRALVLGHGTATLIAIWLSGSGLAIWSALLVAWVGGSVLALALAAIGASLLAGGAGAAADLHDLDRETARLSS